jgi:hypothetical protein
VVAVESDYAGELIVVVDSIVKETDGAVRIGGMSFYRTGPAFSEPFDSRDIGVYKCSSKKNNDGSMVVGSPGIWSFAQVTGKFFPFPLSDPNLNEASDIKSLAACSDWIVVRLRHTDKGMLS